MSSKCDTFNGNQSFFSFFFFAQSHRLRTVSALETPISNHIHFPSPQLNGFSFQAPVIHSPVYIYVAVILLIIKEREIRQTLNVSSPLHMEASISNLCGQEEPFFFLANTIATEEKNPPNKLPLSLSGRSQILVDSGSSVKNKSAAKIVHFTLIPR